MACYVPVLSPHFNELSALLEAKLGSGPNMRPQTDPKLALTECYNCSARAWPYEEWRTEMMPGNINSRGQIGVLV